MLSKECHFIGIGGIGMSGLARILLKKKINVSGSDIAQSYVTEGLVQSGANIHFGHSAKNISPEMTVVYSTDIKESNPEYQAAQQNKCQMLHRSDLLLLLMQPYKPLAVTGTHGKTTTSALLTSVLIQAGLDPSFAIGGLSGQNKTNGEHGEGEYFVAEADESDGSFLKYKPYGAIVTNIDLDHMDHFGTEEALIDAFRKFMLAVTSQKHLFWCGDDFRLSKLNVGGVSYGFSEGCQVKGSQFQQQGWKSTFDVLFQGKHYSKVEVALTGHHGVLNALAVFGLALSLGINEEDIRKAFSSFQGVGRRCEKKGEVQGILFLDDYAHHPTEILTTVNAIRNAVRERRLVAVFQPHRYSRTKLCLGTYGGIFDEVDELIVTDIYSAGEMAVEGLSYENVLNEIKAYSNVRCRYIPRAEISKVIADELKPHDVVVSLGAGDITKLSSELINQLKQQKPSKLKVGLLFGGRSVEHEVSLESAKYIKKSLKSEYYDVQQFGITKQGKWIAQENALEVLLSLSSSKAVAANSKDPITPQVFEKLMQCDIIFPMMHGTFGEDGTIQGFFEMLGKAYVGCDYRSAAISMDKAFTKKLAINQNIPSVPFIDFSLAEWKANREGLCKLIDKTLTYPIFVKPVHLGSSVGVSKVDSLNTLATAIDYAFIIDTDVITESGVVNPREIEFSVVGNNQIKVFPPGEVMTQGKLNDYKGKYGATSFNMEPRAELSKELIEEGMQLAEKVYKIIKCQGMARIDFFLDQQNRYWFNEVNPIPGHTPTSLFPMMCEANGFFGPELTDHLIILGLERKRRTDKANNL